MTEKPMHGGTRDNGFKKPDRADRHSHTHDDEASKSEHKPSGFAPNPNNDSHKPKIVPWK